MPISPRPSGQPGKQALRPLCAALFTLLARLSHAEPLNMVELYLAPAPPLSTLDSTGVGGIVGEVTVQAAALAGYSLRPVSLPWPRSQRIVPTGENLLIIPLSRTPDREERYTWIAPVIRMDRAFFTLGKGVETFAQARETYRRIAVGMGSAQEQKLRDEGFSDSQIYSLKIGENPARMLLLGRVDAWFNGIAETRYIWKEVSDRPLTMSPVIMSSDLYLACSRRCDPQMVLKLKEAVERLRADGSLRLIVERYLKGLPSHEMPP
ncbi:substrate-binding periplasmic protein [Pseudomonas massiliensis]|uniref:substrate-binding periplasmic protein n=1 Tax=Pseudomonas massiliensis TaxID=522492 RepID=UPI00058F1A1F